MIYYKPDFIPQSIVLIGGGGTGSRLIPSLAQLVRTQLRKFNPLAFRIDLPIYIIDGDIVEEKNLMRQLFVRPDVGRNKAVVLAERYSMAFGIPITPVPHYLNLKTAVEVPEVVAFLKRISRNSLIIFAVDSAEARREILKVLCSHTALTNVRQEAGSSPGLLVDAGNEDDFGQVKISSLAPCLSTAGDSREGTEAYFERTVIKKPITDLSVNYLPLDLNYYANLGSSAQEQSCAELPQTLAINQMMATLILSFVQNILLLKAMTYDMVRFSLANGASSSPITAKSIYGPAVVNNEWNAGGPLIGHFRGINHPSDLEAYFNLHVKTPLIKLTNESKKVYASLGFTFDKEGNPVPPAPKLVKLEPSAEGAATASVDVKNPPPLVEVPKRVPRRRAAAVQPAEVDAADVGGEELDSASPASPVAADIPAEIPPLVRIS